MFTKIQQRIPERTRGAYCGRCRFSAHPAGLCSQPRIVCRLRNSGWSSHEYEPVHGRPHRDRFLHDHRSAVNLLYLPRDDGDAVGSTAPTWSHLGQRGLRQRHLHV